jgi:hypothetical protein
MLMEVEGSNDPLDRSHVGRVNVTSITPAALFAKMEVSAPVKFRIKRFLRAVRASFRSRRYTLRGAR